MTTDETLDCAGMLWEAAQALAVSPTSGPAGVRLLNASPTRRSPKRSSKLGRRPSGSTQCCQASVLSACLAPESTMRKAKPHPSSRALSRTVAVLVRPSMYTNRLTLATAASVRRYWRFLAIYLFSARQTLGPGRCAPHGLPQHRPSGPATGTTQL